MCRGNTPARTAVRRNWKRGPLISAQSCVLQGVVAPFKEAAEADHPDHVQAGEPDEGQPEVFARGLAGEQRFAGGFQVLPRILTRLRSLGLLGG